MTEEINLDKDLKQRVITIKIESMTDEIDPFDLVYRMIEKNIHNSTIGNPSEFATWSKSARYYVECEMVTKPFDINFINRDKK